MIIVRLMGGLGNQMFQYAFGRTLSVRHGTELKLDPSIFSAPGPSKGHHVPRSYDLGIFNIQETFASPKEISEFSTRSSITLVDRALRKVFGFKRTIVLEPHFHFSSNAFKAPDNMYLIGYWQSKKYFQPIEPLIRKEFSFKEEMSPLASELFDRINTRNSICINVRRGDFVVNDFHGSLGEEYFRTADEIISNKINDRSYFVFSDDIEWCEKNLRFNGPTEFVSHEYAGPKFQDYLRLMAACKHFVIPNSSFAWWAVWFNQNDNRIVIAPKHWFQDPTYDVSDLLHKDWIRI